MQDSTSQVPAPRRRRHAARAARAVAVIAAILGSSSVAFAEPTTPRGTPSLVGGLGKVVGSTVSGAADTVNGLTGALGVNLGLPILEEFGSLNTGTPMSRTEVRSAIGSSAATGAGVTGAGVDVAIIDTGVAPVGGLRGGVVVNGPDLSLDRQVGLPAGVDAFGHGTHLAGIIAGRDGGIAPGSRLVSLKVGAADGAVDVSQVIAAIDWVVTHRNDAGLNIRVLNLAYGTDSTQVYTSSPLTHAVESAWRNGIVVVVSAGNSGKALVNPATDPFVLTVGAIDANQPANVADDKVAAYSSVGNRTRGVDVLAPGTSIWSTRVQGSTVDASFPGSRSTDGSQIKGSGTSQAAAVVSGAAALLLQKRPGLSPDQVKSLLTSTARPLLLVPSNAQGGGVIDVTRALAAPTPPNKVQPFTRSTGTGSIEAARGSVHLSADDGSTLRGEIDLLGAAWSPAAWAAASTAGTAWNAGTWNGNTWAGPSWATESTQDGVNWEARSWRSTTWEARSWRADLWAARSWRSAAWEARSWRNNSWG